MKNVKTISCYFLILLVSVLLISCSDSTSSNGNPDWVNNLIEEFRNEPVGNPPQSIWKYTYNGVTVYYVPPQCCDQFSQLYDETGNIICAPDGGFTGRGDGRCPDFFSSRMEEELIWQDTRERL